MCQSEDTRPGVCHNIGVSKTSLPNYTATSKQIGRPDLEMSDTEQQGGHQDIFARTRDKHVQHVNKKTIK